MERHPEHQRQRDDRWERERAQRRRIFERDQWPDARRIPPGREWERERTEGYATHGEHPWEQPPREQEPPRYGFGSAYPGARRGHEPDGTRGGSTSYDHDEPWRSDRHGAREDDLPPNRDSYDDRHDPRGGPGAFGERSYAGYGDWSAHAADNEADLRDPPGTRLRATRDLRRPRTSAERWGLARSGATDAWGADLRGAVEARSGRFAGHGPRGYQRSDERIREDACDLLLEADDVDASDVDVSVAGGEVTLQGTVPDRRMKRAAEDLIDGVQGVQQVHNQLRVQTGTVSGAVDANGNRLG